MHTHTSSAALPLTVARSAWLRQLVRECAGLEASFLAQSTSVAYARYYFYFYRFCCYYFYFYP